MKGGGILASLVVLAALATAAPAHGASIIGSNLGSAANQNTGGCNATPCTTTNLALTADLAPNGLTSPINGVVTSWSFKSGSSATVALRVLRPAGGVSFTGAGTSAAVTGFGIGPPSATSLPIRTGDHIGLNASAGAEVMSDDVGGTQLFWNTPPLGDLETRAGTTMTNREVLVQARVEADQDCDGRGDETQDFNGIRINGCLGKAVSGVASGATLTLQVQCLAVTQNCDGNQISLRTDGPFRLPTKKASAAAGDEAVSSAKKKRKKKKKKPEPRVIELGTATFSIPRAETRAVPVPLTADAQKLFRNGGGFPATATVSGPSGSVAEPVSITAQAQPQKKKKKKRKKRKK